MLGSKPVTKNNLKGLYPVKIRVPHTSNFRQKQEKAARHKTPGVGRTNLYQQSNPYMSNPHVLKALQRQRDDLYQSLAAKTLSGLFKQQLSDIRKGRLIYAGWRYPDFRRELFRLSEDTSNDDAFRECVEAIWQ